MVLEVDHCSCTAMIFFLVDQHFIAPIRIRERHPRLHHTSAASGDFLFIQWPPTIVHIFHWNHRARGAGPRPRSQGRFGIAGIRTRTGSDVCSVVTNCATPAPHSHDTLLHVGRGAGSSAKSQSQSETTHSVTHWSSSLKSQSLSLPWRT